MTILKLLDHIGNVSFLRDNGEVTSANGVGLHLSNISGDNAAELRFALAVAATPEQALAAAQHYCHKTIKVERYTPFCRLHAGPFTPEEISDGFTNPRDEELALQEEACGARP